MLYILIIRIFATSYILSNFGLLNDLWKYLITIPSPPTRSWPIVFAYCAPCTAGLKKPWPNFASCTAPTSVP